MRFIFESEIHNYHLARSGKQLPCYLLERIGREDPTSTMFRTFSHLTGKLMSKSRVKEIMKVPSLKLLERDATEELTGNLIAQALGPNFTSRHIGANSDSADCEISDLGVPSICLEVTQDADEDLEALSSKTLEQENGERIPLPAGRGFWIIGLTRDSKLSSLNSDTICSLIDVMKEEGTNDYRVTVDPPKDRLGNLCRQHSITGLRRTETKGDYAYRALPFQNQNEHNLIDGSPELIAEYLEQLLASPAISAKIQGLLVRAGNLDPHLAVIISSATDYSVGFRMEGHSQSSPLPTRGIELPLGLAALWFASFGSGRVINYTTEFGWRLLELGSVANPWWKIQKSPALERLTKAREVIPKVDPNLTDTM